MQGGRGEGGGGKSSFLRGHLLLEIMVKGVGAILGEEHGCLFKEIRYVSSNTTCQLQTITLSRKSFITAA